ncbi:hypothetical protein GQR58_029844 [Nymphon striatum]|nr:hypothetical protein GQR58_029844 [Nymphon striatum]
MVSSFHPLLINKQTNPDIAVLMHNINDLSVLLHEKTYWNANEHRSLLIDEDRSIKALIKQLLPNSYNFAFEMKRKLLAMKKCFRCSKPNLNTFVEISKANKITPVLMTQASRFTETPDNIVMKNLQNLDAMDLSYSEYRELYESMNEAIRTIASEKSVLLIDLAKEVPQTNEYLADPVHFNNKGSELVAEIITTKLASIVAE